MKREIKVVVLLSLLPLLVKGFVDIDADHVQLIQKQKKKQFCYISFVNIDGTVFLVKQKRSKDHLLAVVLDVLAARIAEILNGIHKNKGAIAHHVALIPAYKKFPGKVRKHWPATIHTLASGATIKEKRSSYKKMNIKQAYVGLRRDMLEWMAKHPQLVTIVALDIFLCNHDRHRGNLFYNAQTDSFCAIDMDLLFEYNLPSYAHQNLLRMIEDGSLFPLTTKEVFALFELRKTLQLLVDTYSAEDIVNMFDELVDQAGLAEGSPLCTARVRSHTDSARSLLRQSYRDVHILIEVLADVLKMALDENPVLRNYQMLDDFEKKYDTLGV